MFRFSDSRTTSEKLSNKLFDFGSKQIFYVFLEKLGCDPKQFHSALMDNLPIVEVVIEKNIFIYDIDIEDRDFVGEFARKSIGN